MGNIVVDYDRDDNGLIYVNNKGRSQTFEMDLVFTPESTQQQVRVQAIFVEKDMIKMSKRHFFSIISYLYITHRNITPRNMEY